MDEGADCFSEDGLVARTQWPGVRTQMRTAQRHLHPNSVDIDDSNHQGLVELARRRSDLSFHLLAIACCVMDSLLAMRQWLQVLTAHPA